MPSPAPTPESAARAFPSHPRLDRYFPSASAEEGRTRLAACVQRGEGPALLIGSAGAGKTMLLEVLSETFKSQFAVAHLAGAQLCTRRALLQSILYALELPYREREEGELRLAIVDYLKDPQACPSGALLLIDEAHALAPRLLEELRVLGNVARGGEPLVRLVLAGTTALEEALAAPELEALNQRIAARCYLSPMPYDELVQYVRGHIAATGAEPDELLSGDAAAAVFEATDGIPRLVNQLCDRAIVLAVEAGSDRIDRAAIQRAWSDLHQLPAPWHSDEPAATAGFDATPEPPTIDAPAAFDAPPTIDQQVAFDAPTFDAPTTVEQATAQAAPGEVVAADTAAPAAEWNADAALSEVLVAEPITVSPTAATDPLAVAATPTLAADPFGDDFDEEETLLDPYAAFDNPFPAGTPLVTNREDATISTLVATLAPQLDNEDDTELDEPETPASNAAADPPTVSAADTPVDVPVEALATVGLPFYGEGEEVAGDEPVEFEDQLLSDVATLDIGGDPAVLLIESEPATTTAPVRRQEYRQLFASLRGG